MTRNINETIKMINLLEQKMIIKKLEHKSINEIIIKK